MTHLSNLTHPGARSKRVGRGPGSKRGKTSTRGHKGDKSRSGYKTRTGKEGGQVPLFQKLPTRGFTRGRFVKPVFELTLGLIESLFEEGDVISRETLEKKGYALRKYRGGLKILGSGELTKKVSIEATGASTSAIEKIEKAGAQLTIVSK